MKPTTRHWRSLVVAGLLLGSLEPESGAQVFTCQAESAAAPPVSLVNHAETWRFYKATNSEPVAGWQTLDDTALDATWGSGPGGFGYGDPGIVGENTTLNDMLNRYTTFS